MSAPAPPDLYILSDLHLSGGVSPETGRTARLETFFYDQEFARLIERIIVQGSCRQRDVVLVLNGDVFDFLAITQTPSVEERTRFGMRVSRHEERFGMESEPAKDAWKMRRIVRGHPAFFEALLRLLGAGHRIEVIRGNHDLELFWPEVRAAFYEEFAALAAALPSAVPEALIRQRVTMRDWFYFEPGRIWVEHGHQYEASNSLRYLLNPVETTAFPSRGARRALDLPTGSLFVRYVYNRFKLIDPYSAQVFSLEQYLDLISTYNVIDLAKALVVHFPFFVRALKTARPFEVRGMGSVAAVHRERVHALADESGLGERLVRLDTLRRFPIGVSKYTLFRDMMRPIIRNVVTMTLLVLGSIGGWMLLFSLIQSTPWLAETVLGKASLMAVLAVVTIVGLFLAGTFLSRRYRRPHDELARTFAERAERIAELLDVPLVVFGHSHGVDTRRVRGGRTVYANSGTWTLVRGPWDFARPFARQFTFVLVRDGVLETLRWNDPCGRWEPVVIMEDHEPTGLDRLIRERDGAGHS